MTMNWAQNLTYGSTSLRIPQSVEELAGIVASAHAVRALGSRHSFNTVADTGGIHVSVAELPGGIEVDSSACTATVPAGARYGEFVEELDRLGWALGNLASLPHISVAGAVSTGTHGSGDRNGSLASAVAGFEFVSADGSVQTLKRGDPDFDGAVVSLGALGIMTTVTLDILPRYDVRQCVYELLSWSAFRENFDTITSSAYSVSLFTDWGDGIGQAWLKSRVDDAREAPRHDGLFGARHATLDRHPLPGLSAEHTTKQLGTAGPSWDRLPHFRLEYAPSNGKELQSEFLVPRGYGLDAVDAIRALAPSIRPHLFVSEIRTVAADDLWLSPSHSTDCVALHFTWKQHPEVIPLLHKIDEALAPFAARPHWGKLFETDNARLAVAYPRLGDFRALAERLDPTAKFRNEFLDRWIFG